MLYLKLVINGSNLIFFFGGKYNFLVPSILTKISIYGGYCILSGH